MLGCENLVQDGLDVSIGNIDADQFIDIDFAGPD
jgi:hypothetical protein